MMRLLPAAGLLLVASACIPETKHQENLALWDADGDGEYAVSHGGTDCDDSNAEIGASATEICNAVDDNCDGVVDENYDPRPEECDGIDNDCDGTADESLVGWFVDADGDGYGDPALQVEDCNGQAGEPIVDNADDCDDADDTLAPNQAEACDGLDNDCSGEIDDGGAGILWYADSDGDGHGDPTSTVTACSPPEGYTGNDTDCDDTDASIHPDAADACGDSVDSDCDGDIDDGDATYFTDADADGYGNPGDPVTGASCTSPPSGAVANGDDCNDNDAATNPDASDDTCDGINQDCDGETDEDGGLVWYQDVDDDGYGDDTATLVQCDPPSGYVSGGGDCNDATPAANPGLSEICSDLLDNDCDGDVDEGTDITYYRDADLDTFGASDDTVTIDDCTPPAGYVRNADDCDDTTDEVNPFAVDDTCDGRDDDCNGLIDDQATEQSWYQDFDLDTYGNTNVKLTACEAPSGYVADNTDCNDSRANVNPGATEVDCNVTDEDCDGIDGGTLDLDNDDYSECQFDCDDSDANVYPGAPFFTQPWNTSTGWNLGGTASLQSGGGSANGAWIELAEEANYAVGSAFYANSVPGGNWTLTVDLAARDTSGLLTDTSDKGGVALFFVDGDAPPAHSELFSSDGNGSYDPTIGCNGVAGFCVVMAADDSNAVFPIRILNASTGNPIPGGTGQTVLLPSTAAGWGPLEVAVINGRLTVAYNGTTKYDLPAPPMGDQLAVGMTANAGEDRSVTLGADIVPRIYEADQTDLFCGRPGIEDVGADPPAP